MPGSSQRSPDLTPAARRIGLLLLIAGLAVTGIVTLGRLDAAASQPFLCIACGPLGMLEFILNAGLFIPLGLGLALLGVHVFPGAAALGLLSGTIELFQAALLSGRQPALGDIVANTLGSVLGLSALRWGGALWRPPTRILTILLVTALAVPVATVLLLSPSAAPAPRWWGQHAHIIGNSVPLSGRVREVRLNQTRVADGILADQSSARKVFESDTITFEADVDGLASSPGPAQIAAIADGAGGWVAWIWQDGIDALGGLRLRSRDAKLRVPEIRLPGAFAVERRGVARVTLRATGGTMRLSATENLGQTGNVAIRTTTTRTWMLLWPRELLLADEPVLRTAAWLAGWFGLIGVVLRGWSRPGTRQRVAPLIGLAVIIISLGITPLLTSTPVGLAWEWLAAGTGLSAGFAARSAAWPGPTAEHRP